MSREKLFEARNLIQSKCYDDAAAILRTLPDDPQAKKWLDQMEEKGWIAAPRMPVPAFDEFASLRSEVDSPQLSSVSQPQRSSGALRGLVGLALFSIIALQGAMLVVLILDHNRETAVEMPDTMQVDGNVSIKDAVDIRGPVDISEPVEVKGTVDIGEAVEIKGPVQVTGTVRLEDFPPNSEIAEVSDEKWEYLVIYRSTVNLRTSYIVQSKDQAYGSSLAAELDEVGILGETGAGYALDLAGSDGWELVAMTYEYDEYTDLAMLIFYFKRPLQVPVQAG